MKIELEEVIELGYPLKIINWIEQNDRMADLLSRGDALTTHPMEQGFEAEVIRLNDEENGSYVLKVWSKASKPDVRFQFRLLSALNERGLSVSKPIGWGINSNEDTVLLTSYDGTSVNQLDDRKMKEIANLLSQLHLLDVVELSHLQLPKFDFVDYFYPGISGHLDLHEVLIHLVGMTNINQDRMIHGDFHLGNLVEENERYTVIDWTNGQLGDSRYDFAWSLILKKIYIPERYADLFRSAYLSAIPIPQEELELYEAIAILRWILLNRNGHTPKGPNTLQKVKHLIQSNSLLQGMGFHDLQ
ncbi:phosphotransferase [Cohnella sp. WQ 127256]|uniref:phosphotransferase n=1 Tax=Cohnella sp. WQ 127256 TaxID=2938790 RepID=UPI0021182C29|nr:phosphotransferase [Cohnella sp. WQ 127256]